MIDRNDFDRRINAHRQQIETINRTRWVSVEAARPANGLRQQIAAMMVSLAARLDDRAAAVPAGAVAEPASGFTS